MMSAVGGRWARWAEEEEGVEAEDKGEAAGWAQGAGEQRREAAREEGIRGEDKGEDAQPPQGVD